ATETKALEEGISPRELCDRYYKVHEDIYKWFNISFDRFGRTSTPNHTKITQDIFLNLDRNGFINERTIEQLFCESCSMFLADRYVRGTCPHCGYTEARGDQCENCGKLLDPTDLLNPQCGTCGTAPVIRETNHLYIDLPEVLPQLEKWMTKASKEGGWARNAVQMTQAWIRDGLRERCITRDLQWGIPVPKEGYREKVFYVWFDAPIGYISITANHTDDWQSWWKNPAEVRLYQFVGKDNIPFHTVIFPSSLLGTGENWTLLHHMSSSEYLNYETGKFSKSKGVGVFGTDARDTGIPPDVWRFYIFYNRPERSDALFTWKDFQEKVNSELIGNLSNLVNRTLTFVVRYFDGLIPGDEESLTQEPEQVRKSESFWQEVHGVEGEITNLLERVNLRDAFRKMFLLSSIGNKRFQDEEPWKSVNEDRSRTARLIRDLVYLIRDLAILVQPYIPGTSEKIAGFLGLGGLIWDELGALTGIRRIENPELLFRPLEDEKIEELRQRFAGTQKDRESVSTQFRSRVDLRVARIEKVERHPKADKLYIETISLGDEKRQIVSGLVPYYSEEELEGRYSLLVYNLKPAKLRGVMSQGMLLAAEVGDTVEVIFVDHARPGERVRLEADEEMGTPIPEEITIDEFFAIPIRVERCTLKVEGRALQVGGRAIEVQEVEKGVVG
ncbi:MAG TPA: methionine--tRNA ligase, partial [Spirochaetia bacterium]|nr:methionine--tRNA ligase [Spirochaetia bacterium]